ncbi:MAG: thiamine pyrophosphate-binding protein [Methanophagales archaeon ANME-1-THS]|nr:MAG: thiamine pyrophosphate-binding protein [Methanophagales archaeon ANME-1-THS]
MQERTVSEVIVDQLAAWGVEYVFGLPGTTCLGVVDAIRKHPRVRFIKVRHEEAAALMASAYAKLTGNVGVCLTIAGPGATNLITGLYDAKMDRAPVVALTGQVKLQYIGPGSFQEIDQDVLFNSFCTFNKTINSKEQTIELVTLALKHAVVERGVSHLAIPNDVQKEVLDARIEPLKGRIPEFRILNTDLVERAVRLINEAERPVIIAGWGARAQGEKLLKLADRISAPIITTYRAKGIVPEDHELALGVLGDVGTPMARTYVNASDLLLVFGSSFSAKTNIPRKTIIQVDIDPMNLGKSFPIEVPILGECGVVLAELVERVQERANPQLVEDVKEEKERWYAQLEKEADVRSSPLRGPFIMKVLREVIDPTAIISVDVGDNSFWFGRNFVMTRQTLLMSGYLATMGFGLPGALAAKLAAPDKQVVCITGDGGFAQVMGEFLTAVENKLAIIVVILNNNELAMISMEQKVEGYPKFATELKNPNYADYATSCGGVGFHVTEPNELKAALEAALAAKKPAIVDIETDPKRF